MSSSISTRLNHFSEAWYLRIFFTDGDILIRILSHLVPAVLEKPVHALEAAATGLWHHDEAVDESDKAPDGEEDEGAPFVHRRKDGRSRFRNGEQEEPMETLGERTAEGTDSVGPQFCAKQVWQAVQTYYRT